MDISIDEYLVVPPNWINSLKFRRRWMTTVVESIDGSEQRSALFTWPRRTLAFTILAYDYARVSFLKARLYKNLHGVWGVPLWQDGTELVAPTVTGQTSVSVDGTMYRSFEVGGLCLIYNPNRFGMGAESYLLAEDGSRILAEDGSGILLEESVGGYEVHEIESFGETTIAFVDSVRSNWEIGTEVYPLIPARLRSEQILGMLGAEVGGIDIEAEEEFAMDITRDIGERVYLEAETGEGGILLEDGGRITLQGVSTFNTYRGYPVFDMEPDGKMVLEQRFIHPYSTLAYIGKSLSESNYDVTRMGLRVGYLFLSKQEIRRCLDFFDYTRGRLGRFFVPSWQQDIKVTAPIKAEDYILQVEDIGFENYWLGSIVGRHIVLWFPDGTKVMQRVVGATPTSIILHDPVGVGGDSGQLMVSFLFPSRFDQDEIEVEYLSDSVARVELSFRSSSQLAPTTTTTTSTSTSTTSSSTSTSTTTSTTTTSTSTSTSSSSTSTTTTAP